MAFHRRRPTPETELLSRVALFAPCSQRELERLAGWAAERRVASGTVLLREGDEGDEFYVLAEGLAHVAVGDRVVASILPGTCIGELAMLDELPRSATVTAALPSRLLVFDRESFNRMVDEIPAVRHRLLRIMAVRLRHADELATATL